MMVSKCGSAEVGVFACRKKKCSTALLRKENEVVCFTRVCASFFASWPAGFSYAEGLRALFFATSGAEKNALCFLVGIMQNEINLSAFRATFDFF